MSRRCHHKGYINKAGNSLLCFVSKFAFCRKPNLRILGENCDGQDKRNNGWHQIAILVTPVLVPSGAHVHTKLLMISVMTKMNLNECNIEYRNDVSSIVIPSTSFLYSMLHSLNS